MILIKKAEDLQNQLQKIKVKNATIGFIPTMGALHQGHLSLIGMAKSQGCFTVCSIFINPTQFNDPKDFQKYPVTIDADIYRLETAGCDILFLPSIDEVYPQGLQVKRHYELGYLENILEGKFRPGHFQGVCQVVHRLLEIVQPHQLYVGQKDYQQCMVLAQLIKQIELPVTVELNICPTLRETSGLAMSSRNMRLNETERQKATAIYNCLRFLKSHLKKGSLQDSLQQAEKQLSEAGFKTDYVVIAEAQTLNILDEWDEETKVVALIAAFLNEVRLIDNMILN
ncbi:MAG TPA: pantoate--beta-alanine ligase [Chitinophagaceae bacterium]|jgi:pantoate--beta-alanine ligase